LGRGKNRHDKYVNRLGNLMLLPPRINSKAGAKSFQRKKKIYKTNYLRLVEEILAEKDWNYQTIEAREERLLHWMKETWG